MNKITLFNEVTGKTLTRADLDQSKTYERIFYLVVAFPYIDDEMFFKLSSWAVANRYKVKGWHVDAGITGKLAILNMTLEASE